MSDSICSAFNRNVVPALLTTFSSIITEPKSFAPYPSAICPISGPCVTQELCTLSMLSRKIRASACVRKYSATPVGCFTFRTVDRKSTRLNSSHLVISYAVFCLKKKTTRRSYAPPRARSFHCKGSENFDLWKPASIHKNCGSRTSPAFVGKWFELESCRLQPALI